MLSAAYKHQVPAVSETFNEGMTAALPPLATAYDFLKLYINDDMMRLLVTETNRYASQYIERNVISPHSPVNKWCPTTDDEMYAFIGLALLMGLVYKPRLSMYWSGDQVFSTPVFGQVMSRDRFLLILRFLHVNDNDLLDVSDPDRDRLHKIRPFLDLLKDNCASVYSPGRDLCIDESLVLFKGRLAFKQFIRTKRARFGIKLFELCTSNGIMLDFLVYHGKVHTELWNIPGHNFLFSEQVPLTLMSRYLDRGHRLFLDNYYTSPVLAQYLLDRGTKLVGTVRATRQNFPAELSNASLEKGQSQFAAAHTGMLAVKYRASTDKANKKPKVVYLLSTDHENRCVQTAKTDKDGAPIMKPHCVTDYNKNMGGVDLQDQQLESVMAIRKTFKWYKKLLFRFILQSALSAHKLSQRGDKKKDFLHFLHECITHMISKAPRFTTAASAGVDSVARLTGREHFPCKREYDGKGKKRSSKKKECRVCRARGIRTPKGGPVETTWVCESCPSVPGLCVDRSCFRDYHVMFDYSN